MQLVLSLLLSGFLVQAVKCRLQNNEQTAIKTVGMSWLMYSYSIIQQTL